MQPQTASSAVSAIPPPGRLESFFIFISLLLVTGALEPLIMFSSSGTAAMDDSNPANLLSALIVYLIAFALLARRPAAMLDTIRRNPLLVVVFMLPLITILWSVDRDATFRRAVALMLTGVFCIYIARRLSPDEFVRRLLLALFIGGVASLAYTAFFPGRAIEHSLINHGSWQGVYGHKAILGRIAAVAVTVSVYVRPRHLWERPMRWITIAIFVFLSIKSQSRASWFMLIGGVGCMMVIAMMRARRLSSGLKFTIALALGAVIAAIAIAEFSTLLADFGRDATFSGRTTLWNGAIAVASETHPILGAGYRAFWTHAGAAGVRHYIQDWARLPNHAHNGYLDVWLNMGIPGAIVFALFLLTTAGRLIRRLLREPAEPAWAAFAIFFFVFVLNNCSVTVAFKHTDIAWIFAVLACLYTHDCVSARLPILSRRRVHMRAPPPSPAPAPAYGVSAASSRGLS